ncbi:hypothetical protein ACHAWF_009249 [Thalassiosira exigua]
MSEIEARKGRRVGPRRRRRNGPLSMTGLTMVRRVLLTATLAASSSTFTVSGFQIPSGPMTSWKTVKYGVGTSVCQRFSWSVSPACHISNIAHRNIVTRMGMVRNIDLPEAIVFYGLESMMAHSADYRADASGTDECVALELRPGILRLLNECEEVGTSALLLSEELEDEDKIGLVFQSALEQASGVDKGKMPETLANGDNSVVNFRCLNSDLVIPTSDSGNDGGNADLSDEEYDESIEFYNLQKNGRSPSPAFLLDSLRSVRIDPRGFGGSSGFGRGQWIEPQRSPMPARTVVFIAGDWVPSIGGSAEEEESERSTVKDRCAAARAAGCRIIYLEELPGVERDILVQDDTQAMALCDAVVDTYGNDNPRQLQPITLDAVSTPGDYWLNPPNPRDDVGECLVCIGFFL